MSKRFLFIAAVLACLAAVCSAQSVADVTAPLVFVSKTTSSDDIILGSPVEVIVTVHNYGQSPAFDVVVTDTLEDGTTQERRFESIPYGAEETMRYTVTPKALGPYPIGAATVTYNTEQGNAATEHKAQSSVVREETAYYRGEAHDDVSFRGTIDVLTRERYERVHTRYVKESIAYIFLGVLPAAFPYMLYRVKQAQVDELLRKAKRSK